MKGARRAVKGTITSALLLRLPADLRKKAERASRKAGLSLAEWIRQAIALSVA